MNLQKIISHYIDGEEVQMLKILFAGCERFEIFMNNSYIKDEYDKEPVWVAYDYNPNMTFTFEEMLDVIDKFVEKHCVSINDVMSHGFGGFFSGTPTITYAYKDSSVLKPMVTIDRIKHELIIDTHPFLQTFTMSLDESEFKNEMKALISKLALGFDSEINEEYLDKLLKDVAVKYIDDDDTKNVTVETYNGIRADIEFSDDYDPSLFDITVIDGSPLNFISGIDNSEFVNLLTEYFKDKRNVTRKMIYSIIKLIKSNLNVIAYDDEDCYEKVYKNSYYGGSGDMRKNNACFDISLENVRGDVFIHVTATYKFGLYDYNLDIDVDNDNEKYLLNIPTEELKMFKDVCDGVMDLFDRSRDESIYPQMFKSILNLLDSTSAFIVVDKTEANNAPFGMENEKNKDEDDQPMEIKESNKSKLTFDDVIGMEDVKDKLRKVVKQYKNREKYKAWNIKPIGGVLLYGPSGTGKSYISEAFANEIDATFIKLSAGDIMSKYIGESGKNIKKAFEKARKEKFALIYIDEVDFIANKRGTSDNDKERNATLNELLVQMSSMENDNIFMVFATNMMELLDPAFLRSGRCDFKLEVSLPDFECRKGILEYNSKGRPLADDVDFTKIARNMAGMNCADMAHIANEAARRALELDKDVIEQEDFEETLEEMICGAASKTTTLSEKEKNIVAHHEVGHLVANEVFSKNKTKKISIIPRGGTLGFVLHANEDDDDVFLSDIQELRRDIMVCLAGRAAEDYFLGEHSITGGCSNDLEKATSIANKMVTKYGMSEKIGLVSLDNNDVFMKSVVNEEVKDILKTCYEDVKSMLARQEDLVESLVEVLKDKEELTGNEIKEIIDNHKKVLGATN